MDIFLLVVTIVLTLMILFVNVYLLAVYVHPDDRGFGSSVFPKILVVFGLTLSMGMVLMLPLDVANSVGSGGGLNMDLFWEIAMGAAALLLVVFIPFAYNYYETDETKSARRRFGIAFLYTLLSIIGFGVAFFISYLLLNEASIPIQEQTISTTVSGALQPSTTIINGTLPTGFNLTAPPTPNTTDTVYTIDVTAPIYAMGFFSFLGWFLVVFFGGMGLFSVPMDLINSYRNKPLKKTHQELNKTKQELQNKLDGLIHMGQEIETSQKDAETQRGFLSKRSAKNKVSKNLNKFKASILTLEEEFEKYAAEVNFAKINPLTFKVYLFLGIIFFFVSVLWFVHTLLSSINNSSGYPISNFLGNFFNHLETQYSLGFVATILFGCLAMYLLLVVTKGNVKFGLKIPFLFTIHPMKPNETLMNSFLFNVWMILMSTVGIIQFLTTTLSQYTSITVAQSLFDGVVKYMKFYQFFYQYNIFELAFLAWSVLTLLWLWCCEGRGARVKKANDKKIRKINEAKQMKIEMQTK